MHSYSFKRQILFLKEIFYKPQNVDTLANDYDIRQHKFSGAF